MQKLPHDALSAGPRGGVLARRAQKWEPVLREWARQNNDSIIRRHPAITPDGPGAGLRLATTLLVGAIARRQKNGLRHENDCKCWVSSAFASMAKRRAR
jgi:hypothetical protein